VIGGVTMLASDGERGTSAAPRRDTEVVIRPASLVVIKVS
jgi:hypothetical protein